jgi:hypothetical protein
MWSVPGKPNLCRFVEIVKCHANTAQDEHAEHHGEFIILDLLTLLNHDE